MSGLALIMVDRGYSVSGSDNSPTKRLKELAEQGIKVFPDQSARNAACLSQETEKTVIAVISSAIPDQNPELKLFKKNGVKVWHRSDLLAELINYQNSIAIAGSHGKTTTSTFLTTFLKFSGEDPTAIIGGKVPCLKSNAYSGQGKLIIAEADESDGSLIKLKASLGIITNIELDHTDYYKDLDALIATMRNFAENSKELLVNYDCEIIKKYFPECNSWSIKTIKGISFAAIPKNINGHKIEAIIYEKEKNIGEITIPIPGLHNLSNAIAAIAACRLKGIEFEQIKTIIPNLKTPDRRFDFRGIWEGRYIVDDYAHHPTEIKKTLSMARLMIDKKQFLFKGQPQRLFVVFQPHRFSRTKHFLHEFAIATKDADCIVLAPIYGAGEDAIKNIHINSLGNEIKKLYPNIELLIANDLNHITKLIKTHSKENDLIACIGAGNINTIWDSLKILPTNKTSFPTRKAA